MISIFLILITHLFCTRCTITPKQWLITQLRQKNALITHYALFSHYALRQNKPANYALRQKKEPNYALRQSITPHPLKIILKNKISLPVTGNGQKYVKCDQKKAKMTKNPYFGFYISNEGEYTPVLF